MDRIAVLIPCYNEAQTIEKVVRDFLAELPEATVYVYDNNSTDGSPDLARQAGAVVRRERKQGKGNVIRRMFAEVDAECYLMVDADDTYPAHAAREMTDRVLHEDADMVVGDRLSSTYFEENRRPFHNMGNWLVRKSINILFRNRIKDIMTGYRAFSYRFVKTFPVLSKGFEIETEMSIHAVDKNMFVDNVIIDYRDRPTGSESKLNTYSDGFRILNTIRKLFRIYRPGAYFGLMALFLAAVALVLLIPVLVDFSRTGLVNRFPTLMVCGFVIIAALLAFFTGQVLKTINQKYRQDFEINLLRTMKEFRNETGGDK